MKTYFLILSTLCAVFFIVSIGFGSLENIMVFGISDLVCYVQYAHLDIKEKINEIKNK